MASPLSSFTLFAATPDQVIESRKRSFHSWGTGLTLETYLLRDATCDAFEAAKDGKLVTWVLAPRTCPTTLDFACSCETYRRKGLAIRCPKLPTDTSQQSAVEEVTCYGIASVYTPLSKRKNGYARHMMSLLHWVIAPDSSFPARFPIDVWGAPPTKVDPLCYARFSALWSDVGHEFYESCGPLPMIRNGGWVHRDVESTRWRVGEVEGSQKKECESDEDGWEWLDETGVDKVWKADTEEIKKDVVSVSEQVDTGKVLFTYLPHEGTGAFLHQKNALAVESVRVLVQTFGVVSRRDANVFATWAMDIRPPSPPTLIVTRIRATQYTFEGVLEKVLEAAEKHGMKEVEVWNLNKSLKEIATKLGGETKPLEEHLASFKWYGEEAEEDVVWLFNEKFCWC